MPQNLLDEMAPDGESGVMQNVDVSERQHLKEHLEHIPSALFVQDGGGANVLPVSASHVQTSQRVPCKEIDFQTFEND